jgi:hypothetical protein
MIHYLSKRLCCKSSSGDREEERRTQRRQRTSMSQLKRSHRLAANWILTKHPFRPADGTGLLLVVGLTRGQPLRNALQVKGVPAFPKDHGTVFARILDIRRSPFERSLTDSADFIIDVPRPARDGVKTLDADLQTRGCHGRSRRRRHLDGCIAGSFRHLNEMIRWSNLICPLLDSPCLASEL